MSRGSCKWLFEANLNVVMYCNALKTKKKTLKLPTPNLTIADAARLCFIEFDIAFLNNTRRYGPLRGPTSRLWPSARLFLLLQKKSLLCCFGPFLANFGVQ